MLHMLVCHKVAGFAKWKQVFDSHKEAQEAEVMDKPDLYFLS